ncbi:hypothetical protein BDN70DRAFT_885344 [Pholiota conissans]|uniref:Uncharacterized protein n=1 Tax=Pholiota conissans TaxID=109636 RepID=A0A9P6CVA6_9AGAR|nr:hypothetical protein BDN70DRAFT_885344 [Pholiota conissans]
MMMCALMAPELIMLWAFTQRWDAKRIMEEYNRKIHGEDTSSNDADTSVLQTIKQLFQDSPIPPPSPNGPRWTLAHGFFLQMGGFMLADNGRPVHILLDDNWFGRPDKHKLIHNIQKNLIALPRITEEDIQDRSKGDLISKGIILLQTSWFVAQCIARWAEHLPVTELEVVTLGFAMLNGMTYALWWNKPQNVGRPEFLELRAPLEYCVSATAAATGDVAAESGSGSPTSADAENESVLTHAFSELDSKSGTWFERSLRKRYQNLPNWVFPVAVLYLFLGCLLRPLMKLLDGGHAHKFRVSTFYMPGADGTEIYKPRTLFLSLIGTLFGAVHLIPSWFIVFSSSREKWLWRVSAIIITAAPTSFTSRVVLDYFNLSIVEDLLDGISFFLLALYPFARIILLVLSLISLQSLPLAALQTIEWTTFIPHL